MLCFELVCEADKFFPLLSGISNVTQSDCMAESAV